MKAARLALICACCAVFMITFRYVREAGGEYASVIADPRFWVMWVTGVVAGVALRWQPWPGDKS